jgi:hypothetical protein
MTENPSTLALVGELRNQLAKIKDQASAADLEIVQNANVVGEAVIVRLALIEHFTETARSLLRMVNGRKLGGQP